MVALNQVVKNTYYKGTYPPAPNAPPEKSFFYVTDVGCVGTQYAVEGYFVVRKAGAQWVYTGLAMGTGTTLSPFRRTVTPSEVSGEGFALFPPPPAPGAPMPPPPVNPPPTNAPLRPVPTPRTSSAPSGATRSTTDAPLKPTGLRSDGTPRARVEGNETSRTCLRCAKPTVEVLLFRWTTRHCPACE